MNRTNRIAALRQRAEAQKHLNPEMYGRVDFSVVPERFTVSPDDASALGARYPDQRAKLLTDSDRVELIRAYSMMGDVVADRYARLMRQYGFRGLVGMLVEACDKGVEAVADAPPELVDFIRDMERVPDWLDMELVEKGARLERNAMANLAPFAIRGAFIATFMNKYAALPMAITNTLSSQGAARRVKETATFFSTSVLPGALGRFGAGFKAAAKVRLMHSMVRANVLRRPDGWDLGTYGIPIPQVDQMPAGLIGVQLMSAAILATGRTQFTPDERARVEFARYRCFLLGLPEDLLADTPQGIFDLMIARNGTLRAGYDDTTCGELLRATMEADLRPGDTLGARIHDLFERSFAKVFFVKHFLLGNKTKAASIGVHVTARDTFLATLAGLSIVGRMKAYRLAARVPGLRERADKSLVARISAQLATYGHADFVTDAAKYRTAVATPK